VVEREQIVATPVDCPDMLADLRAVLLQGTSGGKGWPLTDGKG
jgi:hypothetical protein